MLGTARPKSESMANPSASDNGLPSLRRFFQLATIIMKHEGFDFTLNVWDENIPKSDEKNAWHGNIAVPHLIFDDKNIFNDKLGELFSIEYEKLTECFVFINSGGVTSKTAHVPMNNFFLNILHRIDNILVKLFPKIFCMGRRLVLKKMIRLEFCQFFLQH